MQEAEEQDTCRICSAPGEPDQPLFYPCKCSGTIRYIHQDCLTTWLSHSKKKTCDVCKHPYSFTKVYATDMPATLPPLLLTRRLAQQALFACLFGLRAIMIAIVWLAVLPWITIWTWRVYFTMGESTAWWISGRDRLTDPRPIGIIETLVTVNETVPLWKNTTLLQRFTTRPFWQAMSADIFAGQIIASLIVLIFVAVFLLREWISQNARPGMFEDDDMPVIPQEAPPLDPAPPIPAAPELNGHVAPHPLRVVPQDRELEARRQARLLRARRPLLQNPRELGPAPRLIDDIEHIQPRRVREFAIPQPQFPPIEPPPPLLHIDPPPLVPMPPLLPNDDAPLAGVDKGKAREQDDNYARENEAEIRMRIRRRLENIDRSLGINRDNDAGPSTSASTSNPQPGVSRSTAVDPPSFEFTFRPPAKPLNGHAADVREPIPEMPAHSLAELQAAFMAGTAPIPEDPPRPRSLIFAELSSFKAPSRLPTPDPDPEPSSSPSSGAMHVPISPTLRRPPMPNTVNAADDSSPSKLQPAFPSGPLASPSLATYVAPEELEAGSSSATGYFEGKKRARAEMEETEEEFRRYFPMPIDDGPNHGALPGAAGVMPLRGVEAGAAREAIVEEEDQDQEDEEGEDPRDRDPWDMDMDRDEDEDEDDDALEFGGLNIPNRPGAQVQQAQIQAAVEQLNEVGDDLEGGVEDDMEGALEAIGLRGPIFGVVQNAVLMIFVLDTAIGFGVWLPFTLGKTTALLSLDPPRALHLLHLPIRAMRVVTDPFVDFFTLILGRFVFPLFSRVLGFALRTVSRIAMFFFGNLVASPAPTLSQNIIPWMSSRGSALSDNALQWFQSSPQESSPSMPQRIDEFFESDSMIARFLEPYFAHLGREIRLFTERFQTSWVHLTLGHGTSERAFAIGLGYTVVALILALYLNIFTVGNARTAGRAVRNAVRQQLLVVKVAMFIIIELVIFPLGCGVMLDGCTIWVFPEASLESRIAFFTQAPLTAMFYHWVAGTMFMYQFAILLAGCRNIMRPGAMWFIKDPQDQNFHPIRDILDRPTLTQFRKLMISAFMYAMVVACGVGSLAILLFIGSKSIFPLRWKTREPLSDVPVDLLFLQIVLPYTMRYLRPRKIMHRTSIRVWKFLATRLRLTSYMFGDRHPKEEYSERYRTWIAFFWRSATDVEEAAKARDGNFRRVPNSDNIALPRDMRATVEVLENGTPVNDAAKELMAQQNAEAAKAKRDVKDDYIITYFPPHFRTRIIAFVAAVWTIVAVMVATCIALPVQLGRRIFMLFTSSQVHDGYSFLAGFYVLWACYVIAKAAEQMDKRRQRRTGDGPRADFTVFFAKRSLLWLSKITYMVIFLGVIIPTLLGLVVDLYIVMPIRLTLNPNMIPKIRLVDMWSLGLIYCKIAIRMRRRVQLPAPVARALQSLLNNGWTHPDPRRTTKELILPLSAGLLGMLVVPAGIVYVLKEILEVLMHAYPGIFAAAGFSRIFVSALTALSSWSQSIRDKEFLVEMRLQNLEPNKTEKVSLADSLVTGQGAPKSQ
ncbi:hypothetical protein HYDPIDRAFT_175219 [Hydnomerulius pinastri MD-312]|uniref:RING-type E3 ubiquitin transferase n=1 Tax=Hydnomerulius pinastri MD-312 TaxID=994086 RepID=A0A0C9W2I0_9AGAM|nr:hypothetical protein HYDPIDRAFT_175219 [Hydnomerulius pinastri MD-312]